MSVVETPRIEKKLVVKKREAPRVTENWVREALSYIIDIVVAKCHYYVVKPKDLVIYLGVVDHGAMTRLGRVLSLLERVGLVESWNNSRPTRYALIPRSLWKEFIELCKFARFRCETEGGVCGLVGKCPYWRLLEVI